MPSPLRRHWSLAAPMLALAALFGMHGLGDHSGEHMAATSHHAVTAPAMGSGSVDADVQLAAPDGRYGLNGPAFVCFGIIVGAAGAMLALRGATQRTPWLMPRLAWTAAPAPQGRDPDPPVLADLSVSRC